MIATVVRTVDSAAGSFRGSVNTPGRAAGLPQRSVDGLRIARFERQVDGAGIFVLEEDALPIFSSVVRTEDAAFGSGAVGVAEGGDKNFVGILGIDKNSSDVLRISETDMCPCFSSVRGFVHAISGGDGRTHISFTGADVNYLRIGSSNGDGADGGDRLRIKNRIPGATGVV